MSESIQSSPTQTPKMLLVTALITAMTTIGVSFIGVVPQLRGQDTGTINSLQKTVTSLQGELERIKGGNILREGNGTQNAPPTKKQTVEGKVLSADGKRLMSGVDVYLLPQDNGLPITQTDFNGDFFFPDLPSGNYSILVRERDGMSGITYLNENKPEVTLQSVLIKYRIHDKGGK